MKKSNSIKKSHKIKDLMPLLFFLLLCAAGMSKGFTEMKMFPETSPAMDTSASQNTPTTFPVYGKSAYRAAEDLGTSGNIVNPCFETVTQTIELTAGWNWISSYVDMNEVDGLAMLEEALGDYGVTIATSDDIAEYLGDGFWLGLEGYQWANSEMIMVEVSEDCTVSLGGSVVDPSTISITINPGWNWIGFPFDSEMSLEEALAVFEPEFGDGIASYEGITEYIGVWTGDFETLEPGQGYLYYSASDEPKTLIFQTELPAPTHEYVDLGLPSGTLWATYNVGADTPEEYGDYFAWGETQPKDTYTWSTYQYANGGSPWGNPNLTKYCANSQYGYNGYVDDLTILLPEDDAATANWGSNWRMPTQEEWWELGSNTTHTWTTQNGVNGRLFTAANGNSIFLPAAGCRYDSSLNLAGGYGRYWSSTLNTSSNSSKATMFHFHSGTCGLNYENRSYGFSVRAVRVQSYMISVSVSPSDGGNVSGGGSYEQGQSCTLTATPNEGYAFTHWTEDGEVVSTDATYSFTVTGDRNLVANFDHAYVDLGLPSGLLWATCNVGADIPEGYGDYFAWGETQPRDYYSWSTYRYCHGTSGTLTKYCNKSSYGYNGFIDNLTTLLAVDDAATANWGYEWRMPTQAEWQELFDNTTSTWTTKNGVNGRAFTAANGNCVFMPAAGSINGSSNSNIGSDNYCWSSSLGTNYPYQARCMYYSRSGASCTTQRNRFFGHSVRAVRVPQSNAPTGAIDGKFTINGEGGQVYFSQGNLQYQASTNTWKFAENQWDYVGEDNENISSTYDGWIDLFGWGTSGWDSGNTYYQPWSSADYDESNGGQLYGPPGEYALIGDYANADWGVYNPISNGGNTANQWRTLTQPEWNYVFNTRATTSGIRYAKANVDNVNGVILLPDDWNSSTYSLSNTNTDDASFSSNTISVSQWTTLENAGAVFLPAAGYRNGASVYGVGSFGNYWSASYYDSGYAFTVGFYDSGLGTNYNSDRYYGRSVRLVRVAE